MKMHEQASVSRKTLSPHQMEILDCQIIPTARRWLRLGGGLETHAIQTLTFWDEPLIDDHGRKHGQ